ncbi:MAG: nucleotidyltransferase domain-containing protein [Deltaproteobacteria bacterium]|nr:nucleotidyltransferase domain-containing protein [Deltaproteobacteria bacterium]
MALSKHRLDRVVRGFISRLASEIAVEEVILFGSYAHGNAKEHSDIDLAIISDWFRDKTRIENMQYLSRVAAKYNSLIEAVPFTVEEYRKLDNRTFLASILKTGKRYPLDNLMRSRHTKNSPRKPHR